MYQMYMYDVRGIQSYIFRTNKVKEIIGASRMVRDEMINLFESCSKGYNAVLDYEKDSPLKMTFDDDNTIDAEIFYYGGGNLLVLYRNETIGEDVSIKMRKQLVKDTYSLQLAVAHVDVTGSDQYKDDYQRLREEMERVKAKMPMVQPVAGFPITANDPVTGFPFSKSRKGSRMTYETNTKLEVYENMDDKDDFDNNFGGSEDESLVAIIHIDGNNMGKYILKEMKEVKTYTEAAAKMRGISSDIKKVFNDNALKTVTDALPEIVKAAFTEGEYKALPFNKKTKKKMMPFRTIISAGDDITFICNAKIALQCVERFMDAVLDENNVLHFNACAGIYVTHTKFPFSRAYEYAEQLCSNAKKYSRKKDGSYIDFQVNYTGILNDVDVIRERNYVDTFNNSLIGRPYYIGKGTGERKHVRELVKMIQDISAEEVARSKIKNLRLKFISGDSYVKQDLTMINSRLSAGQQLRIQPEDYPLLFDAIDVIDLSWGNNYE